jgi:hypothetical protein
MSETPTTPEQPDLSATTVPAVPPPSALAVPTVKSSEEYFNSSRLKVIGMITAATVAVGALGGIAGVAFDPDPVPKDHVVQPGGDTIGSGTVGNSAPHGKGPAHSRAVSRAIPGSDATESPSTVGTVSPGSGGFSSSPTDEPSDLTEEPTPTDGGDNGDNGGGQGTTIEATGVDIYVPPGWNVDFQDESRVFQSDGSGSFSFAFSYVDDPSVAAGDVISANLENLLPPENYTQLQTSDVVPLQPFGSVVSLAGIEYEALWVDNQGSISIHGQIYVSVRQDGTVLGILVEHVPAEDFESAFEDMVPILDNSFGRFGGLG